MSKPATEMPAKKGGIGAFIKAKPAEAAAASGAVLVIVYALVKKKSSASSSTTSTTDAIDPATGVPYSEEVAAASANSQLASMGYGAYSGGYGAGGSASYSDPTQALQDLSTAIQDLPSAIAAQNNATVTAGATPAPVPVAAAPAPAPIIEYLPAPQTGGDSGVPSSGGSTGGSSTPVISSGGGPDTTSAPQPDYSSYTYNGVQFNPSGVISSGGSTYLGVGNQSLATRLNRAGARLVHNPNDPTGKGLFLRV